MSAESEFVMQQRNKPRRLNNLKAIAVTKEELEFVRELRNKLNDLDLSVCRNVERLKPVLRKHYVVKGDKVYVYEYYEVETWGGEILFRAKVGTEEERIASKLVHLRNVTAEACDSLLSLKVSLEYIEGFVRELLNKPDPEFVKHLTDKR